MSSPDVPPDVPKDTTASDAQVGRGVLFRIGRNVGSILLSGAAGEVVNTYAVGLAAIKLGAGGFGAMAAAQAFVEPFQSLAMFGLSAVAMTLAARRGGTDGTLLGTLSALHTMLALVAVAAVLVVALATGRLAMVPLLLVLMVNLLVIPVSAPSNLPLQFDQAMHRAIALPSIVGGVRLALAYAAVHSLNTPVGHQLAVAGATLVGALLTWALSQHYYPRRWHVDRALGRELLALAWPVAVLEVVVMIYSRASYFFLEGAGPQVQGEFAAADRLSRPVLVLAGALVASSLPSVARLAADEPGKVRGTYLKVIGRSSLTLVPVVALAAWLAPPLIVRFLPDYAGAVAPFRVLLVAVMFMFLNQLSSMFLVGMGRFRLIMVVAMVNLVVYVALAAALVPRFAAVGAALSTAIMEGVNCVQQILILAFVLRSPRPPAQGSAT